ncbi:MAG: hypothetical protein RSF70_10160, partial [Ruthenibacterium sp.]
MTVRKCVVGIETTAIQNSKSLHMFAMCVQTAESARLTVRTMQQAKQTQWRNDAVYNLEARFKSKAKAFVLGTYHGLPAENLNEYLA